MHFLYVLECSGGHLFLGVTVDPRERVQAHEKGRGARFTAEHGVDRLVYVEPFADRDEAERAEREMVRHLAALRHPLSVAGGRAVAKPRSDPPDPAVIREARDHEKHLGDHPRAEVYRLARRPPLQVA